MTDSPKTSQIWNMMEMPMKSKTMSLRVIMNTPILEILPLCPIHFHFHRHLLPLFLHPSYSTTLESWRSNADLVRRCMRYVLTNLFNIELTIFYRDWGDNTTPLLSINLIN